MKFFFISKKKVELPAALGIRGFTVVEMLIVIFISTIISLGGVALFREVYSGSRERMSSLGSVDQARLVAVSFTNELRNAATGNDGSYPLGKASTTEIILYTSFGATGSAVNRVRYFASSTALYKGIVIPTGSPLSYNLSSEKVIAVQNGLVSTTTALFSYYDGAYAGATSTAPLAQPVNVNQVKFVQMNIPLLTQSTRTATSTFTLSAGATMRTLKANLGN